MLNCFLLLAAGLMFALQFCLNKYFQTYKPKGESSSVLFALIGKVCAAAFFLAVIPFTYRIYLGNGYTVWASAVQAVLNLLITLFGVRVLAVGSVALYTLAMMLGGMAVPVVFGVFLFGDSFGWLRAVAFALIAFAVVLSVKGERKKTTAAAAIMYAVLFLCNGFIGVFTALHTNIWGTDIPDVTFMFVSCLVASGCYVPVFAGTAFYERRKNNLITTENTPVTNCGNLSKKVKILFCLSPVLAGILNGVANFLIVMGTAADGIGSVVTFPLVTGGTILFTTLTSMLFYKEKPELKKWLGVVLILVALVIFIL
ncbi:MAG: hypothetical protein HFE35_01910 [Clostridia bacterium]|nr:hypothetical protein [Clostridia bacterium]